MYPYSISESVYDSAEYLERDFQIHQFKTPGAEIREVYLSISAPTILKVTEFLQAGLPTKGVVYQIEKATLIYSEDRSYLIRIDRSGQDNITVRVMCNSLDLQEQIANTILAQYCSNKVNVKWMYGANGDSVELPISDKNLPKSEFYPSIPDLHSYYDKFDQSDANILLLIGPPGTGKTSFIRGLLHHTQQKAILSYDAVILENDRIFAEFMSGNRRYMVLEDADSFLASRSKGNTVMHKFLNVGDGLVSTKQKKIIFSTNLPSVRDVDEALLRPGRCFDVLKFGRLSKEQALAIDPQYTGEGNCTLAELLARPISGQTLVGTGFVK